jgi:hypothetical protein
LFAAVPEAFDGVALLVAAWSEGGWPAAAAAFAGPVGFLVVAFGDGVRDAARA